MQEYAHGSLYRELNSVKPIGFRTAFLHNRTGNERTNVTWTIVRATTVGEEKSQVLNNCACSLSHPACKARASYHIVIYGLPGCILFVHIIHKQHYFRGVIERKTCLFLFSLHFCLQHFSF
jgi:hypothetical protein